MVLCITNHIYECMQMYVEHGHYILAKYVLLLE